MVNEMLLKDSPFRLISCTINHLQINNLSLNLLTQNVSVEVGNVRVTYSLGIVRSMSFSCRYSNGLRAPQMPETRNLTLSEKEEIARLQIQRNPSLLREDTPVASHLRMKRPKNLT